jgi:hypothetical protein
VIDVKILGVEQLVKKLNRAIKEPVDKGIKEVTLWTEKTVKVSTPVDENRLRPSMTHHIEGQVGRVGTITDYAPFVEYGTRKMEARHVVEDSAIRVLGKGMFTYTMELLKDKIKEFTTDIGKAIMARFG